MVTKTDKFNMRKIILDFPRQFRTGIEAGQGVTLKPGTLLRWPENIIVCGMGGSALPGDILITLRPLDVFSYKSYRLPPQAGNESLIILFISDIRILDVNLGRKLDFKRVGT